MNQAELIEMFDDTLFKLPEFAMDKQRQAAACILLADRLMDCNTDLEILTRLADLMEAGEKPMFNRIVAEKTEEFGKRLDMAFASDAYQNLERENAKLKEQIAELKRK